MALFDGLAATIGSAVRAFNEAAGHGPARRPNFLGETAREYQWKGGDIGDQTAAALRSIQNSWVYMMIDRKAKEKSAAQLYVVDNPTGLPGAGSVINGHDLLRIFHNPNPHMSGQFLSTYMDWWLDLMGNCYLFLAPDEDGNLAELWPLPSHRVEVVPGDEKRFIDYYEYTANGIIYKIPAEYVYHEMYANPFDMFRGLGPLIAAILPSDADSAMAEWNGAFFGENNVMPSSVISLSSGEAGVPIDPSDITALKDSLTNEYKAIERKTAIVGAFDMKVALLGWSAKDMDFLAGRQFTKEEIILILGGFPGMFDKNATEANATVADNMFKEKTIWPLLGQRAGAITNQILRRFYSKSHEARYVDIRPVNRQMNISESDASVGVMYIDERRKRFWGLAPLPDGKGQRLQTDMLEFGAPSEIPGASAPITETNTTLPNPAMAAPLAARSLTDDLKAWRWRSTKSLGDGRSLTLDFKSDVIPGHLKETILDGLGEAHNEGDVKAIFTLAADSAQKGIIRSWRPWSSFEEQLLAVTSQALLRQAEELENAIRGSGTADPLSDPVMWRAREDAMREMLEPVFLQLAAFGISRVQRTTEMLGDGSVTVNWNLVNKDVESWARQHAGEMVSNVTRTTRDAVANQVAAWSQTGEGVDGLLKRIQDMTRDDGAPVFGPVRAEMIAITESTNVYAGANSQAWTSAGYAPAVFKPGAHVRCRCYLQPFKMPDGLRVLVWYTAMDERVCTDPITTPWGRVDGCAALHRVVVSEGPHLGKKVSR
jgi:HK97 family phage portal protein